MGDTGNTSSSADLPHYKLKQALLHGNDSKPGELSRLGRRFLEEGWLNDAIDFFKKAEDSQGLATIREISIEEGDIFVLRQVIKAGGEAAGEDEWKQIGERALELGKLQFAREAFRIVGDRKAMEKIDQLIEPAPEEIIEARFEEGGQDT
ncbi:MAG TPA: hypothetical protein VM425_05930 [Myxococcota bacterium]|nr:hypothetical protein [Myxococcota bacterium]